MKKLPILLLTLAILACSFSGNIQKEVSSVATHYPTATNTLREATVTPSSPVFHYSCVVPSGLWLRSSPNVSENKLMALPETTRLLVISSGGTWSRVYLKSYDLYGYVRTSYLGDCP